MKQSRAKILLFLVLSAIAIPLLVIALQKFNIFAPNAAGAVPQFVTISNLTDTTATITWTTATNSTVTDLQWGDTTLLGHIEPDFRDKRDNVTAPRMTHFVQLTGLQPGTTYYYRIVAGTTTYPNSSESPLSFKTLATTTATQPPALTIYGDTSSQSNDAIIVVYVSGTRGYSSAVPLSTTLNTDGTWFVNIGTARSSDGTFANPSGSTQLAILGIGTDGNGYIGTSKPGDSPLTLKLDTQLTQSAIDQVLLVPPTPSITPKPTTTTTTRQDVPLRPIGATDTPTPTTSLAPSDSLITRDQLFNSFAAPSISNVTDNSLSIMFVTTIPLIGTLNWGTSSTTLSSNRLDDRDNTQATARYIHHYTLTGLSANLPYFFKPTADTVVRMFTTPAAISLPSGQTIITGSLTNATGECLVRTQIQRNSVSSSVITTLPNSLHTWAVNVMPVRTGALDTYMLPVATDTVLTNAFCIAANGDAYYQASTTTLQEAVTSGITLNLVKIQ